MRRLRPLCPMGSTGLGVVTAKTALARDSQYGYWGLGAGQSRSQIDDKYTSFRLLKSSGSPGSPANERQDTGYKLFGGYRFSSNFVMQTSYFNLGKFTYATPIPMRAGLARLGVRHVSTRYGFGGAGLPESAFSDNSTRVNNVTVGLSLQYKVTPSVPVRAEADRFGVRNGTATNGDVNYYSMSMVFPFGRKVPQKLSAAAQFFYTAPPPPPPPIPLASPLPPAFQTAVVMPRGVQFSADSLFTFDKAVVLLEGGSSLDSISSELQETRFSSISVEGNTDRLRSDAYNLKLWQERAGAVKAHLVTNFGIDVRKITATVRGKTNPKTKTDDCTGLKPTPKLIVCLQPDRRFFVEVAGER